MSDKPFDTRTIISDEEIRDTLKVNPQIVQYEVRYFLDLLAARCGITERKVEGFSGDVDHQSSRPFRETPNGLMNPHHATLYVGARVKPWQSKRTDAETVKEALIALENHNFATALHILRGEE